MQSQYWCFTDYQRITLESWATFWEDRKHLVDWLIGQLERCPRTGRLHCQGFIAFTKRLRPNQVREHLEFEGKQTAHVERMKGTIQQQRTYVHKDDTCVSRADGGWRMEFGDAPQSSQGKRSDLELIRDMIKDGASDLAVVDAVPGALRYFREMETYRRMLDETKKKPMEEIVLRDWQEELLSMLTGDVKPRRIFWVWSPHSAVGKTTTMRYIMANKLLEVAIGDKNLNNFMCSYRGQPVIWFDFSRSDPLDAVALDVLEKISNTGPVFSGKYSSCQKWVSAHVVVTCNRPPPDERLPNRCVEYRIDKDGKRIQMIVLDENAWWNPEAV